MHKLLFIIVLLLLDINEPGYAQGKEDVLILFVNEPLPPGAVKLGEKKVDEAYDCYTVFEENVAWRARKFKANLARVDTYRIPSYWHASHTGQVSFYTVPDFEAAAEKIRVRRDSIEQAHITSLNMKSMVYFFRPWSSIKTGFDLYLNGKAAIRMKPDSVYEFNPLDKSVLNISGQVSANKNEVDLSVKPGKVYYIECRTLGTPPLSIFPQFCVVSYPAGRFLFEELEKGSQAQSKHDK